MSRYKDKNLHCIPPNLNPDKAEIVPGSSIYISDFVCEFIRCLKLLDYKIAINDLLLDSMCLKYIKAALYAIPIFERTHPNKIALFMFDNSSNHSSFAKDALLVSQMSIKDSTKKPLLCTGKYHDGFEHIITYRDSNSILKPKRIRRVLDKRSLWIPGPQKTVSKALDFVGLLKIHYFACHSKHFISTYEFELFGKTANYAEK
ncbi:2809_t:CDS:2, partial [Dentiscutata erythropus]